MLDVILVHAAAAVACVLVALVQVVMLLRKVQALHTDFELSVLLVGTALAACGLVLTRENAQRLAGAALAAIGAVGK